MSAVLGIVVNLVMGASLQNGWRLGGCLFIKWLPEARKQIQNNALSASCLILLVPWKTPFQKALFTFLNKGYWAHWWPRPVLANQDDAGIFACTWPPLHLFDLKLFKCKKVGQGSRGRQQYYSCWCPEALHWRRASLAATKDTWSHQSHCKVLNLHVKQQKVLA